MSGCSRLAIAIALLASLVLAGCGGDTAPAAEQEEEVDTGTITGRVIRADDTTKALRGSVVSLSTGQTAVTDAQGNFTIQDVPVGTGTLQVTVDTVTRPDYGTQTVSGVAIVKDQITAITIAVLPLDVASPSSINIAPSQATVDINGEIQFVAPVNSASGLLIVQPTWYLTNAVGVIDVNGKFTALAQGTGTVVATSGDISAQATVVVVGARAPDITSVLVSPSELNASGGDVAVTVAVNDGDGLDFVRARLVDARNNIEFHDLVRVSGTVKDGTYSANVFIDPNPLRNSQEDATQPLTYTITIYAQDTTGATSISQPHDVVVRGIDEPGPPPPI